MIKAVRAIADAKESLTLARKLVSDDAKEEELRHAMDTLDASLRGIARAREEVLLALPPSWRTRAGRQTVMDVAEEMIMDAFPDEAVGKLAPGELRLRVFRVVLDAFTKLGIPVD